MKIQKIVMETDEGRFEYHKFQKNDSKICSKCAFRHVDCQLLQYYCFGGYRVKVDDNPVTNGDRIRQMTD